MADNEKDDMTVVPIPASESQAEHDRIRNPTTAIRNSNGKAKYPATTVATTKRLTELCVRRRSTAWWTNNRWHGLDDERARAAEALD